MDVLNLQGLEALTRTIDAIEAAPGRAWGAAAPALAQLRAQLADDEALGRRIKAGTRLVAAAAVLLLVIGADLLALAWRALQLAHAGLLEQSEALGRWYARRLGLSPVLPVVAPAPRPAQPSDAKRSWPVPFPSPEPLVAPALPPAAPAAPDPMLRIIELREQGLGQRTIARRLGVTRHAVRVALATTERTRA